MKGRILISILCLLSSLLVYSQSEFQVGSPLFPSPGNWYEAEVDPTHAEALRAVEQVKGQPWQFAIPVEVNWTPANAGYTVRRGNETVWILPVSSKGALSLNVVFEPFSLPDGAYVYLYDAEKSIVRGAFTSESTAGQNSLPVMPVPGERMIIECHFPGNAITGNSIGVRQVSHDFAGFFGPDGIKDLYYGRSGDCEVDLNCSSNSNYATASRSVVRLLVDGSELCTGVMVNNTGSEYKAYLLTANHCIETPEDAENTIFVFNYKSPWCNGPDMSNLYSIAGSSLLAENPEIDFSLVELSQFPSMVFRPFFAGWDITSTPPSNTFAIHHPEGDVMKLTIDDNQPISASYPVEGFVSYGFWRVLRWETGTTEPGSSGGPLFDQNGRVRGTLTGGGATCIDPTNDYYAKISRMFTISSVPYWQLRSWLDPSATGATVAGGRDPYGYNLSRSDTIGGMPAADPGNTDNYASPGWGLSTGNNSDGLVRYAEYIPFSGTGEIAWLRLTVSASSFLSVADSVRFFIWSGGTQPETVIASRRLRLNEIKGGTLIEVDFGRNIKVTGPFYAGYSVHYKTPLTQPQPQFAIAHSSPWPLSSQNSAFFNDGSVWKPFTQHPSFPMSVSLGIKAVMVENSVLNTMTDPGQEGTDLEVFPNPFRNSVYFRFREREVEKAVLTLWDNTGRIITDGEYRNVFPGILPVELSWLSPGVYHYGLQTDTILFTGTLIKTDSR